MQKLPKEYIIGIMAEIQSLVAKICHKYISSLWVTSRV
jgi:hypothetical protein